MISLAANAALPSAFTATHMAMMNAATSPLAFGGSTYSLGGMSPFIHKYRMMSASSVGGGGGASGAPPAGGAGGGDGPKREGETRISYEPKAGVSEDPQAVQKRADFLKRFFDLASSEYDHAATFLEAIMLSRFGTSERSIRVLDVGCGQGHLLERLLEKLPHALVSKIVVDYLDPQAANLDLYRQRLSQYNLGTAYQMRWEEFVHRTSEERHSHYDVILLFQSLYSYDLARYGRELTHARDFLRNNGVLMIGHSTRNAVYLKMLADIGHLFHEEVPHLNAAEDIANAFKEKGYSPVMKVRPFRQRIARHQKEDLMLYLAACLYLASPTILKQRWGEVESYLKARHLDRNGDDYVFEQDIAFIEAGK